MIENISEGPSDSIFIISSKNTKRSIIFEDEEDFLIESNDNSAMMMIEDSKEKVPLLKKREKLYLFVFVFLFLAALILAETILYHFWENGEVDKYRIDFEVAGYADVMRK